MESISSYILSAYSFISKYSLDKLLDVGYRSKNGNPIPSFDENLLIDLCSEVAVIFSKENNVLEISGDVIIVGDIHGSLHDLLRILKFIQGQNSKVLFLGDYVDRGDFSLECITLLFALKAAYPSKYFLIRGNHEFDSICSQYGFKNEILNYHSKKQSSPTQQKQNPKLNMLSPEYPESIDEQQNEQIIDCHFYTNTNCHKYTEVLYKAFLKAFSYLPLAAILNNTTFCIHGGLSPNLDKADKLNRILIRPIDKVEDSPILSDVMWSDPSNELGLLFEENPRGMGYLYNGESVSQFLKASSFTRLIRAHQCVNQGILRQFSEKCITVFSASSYDKPLGNSSSILQLFQKDDSIQAYIFEPLIRLPKSEAYYYKVQSLYANGDKIHVCFSLLHPKLSNASERSIITKNTRQIRSHTSENSLLNLQSPSSRLFFKPKFITNQRRSLNFVQIKKSFTSCTSSTSESDDIPSQFCTDGTY